MINRKKIRLPKGVYAQRGAFFHIVGCCNNKRRIFEKKRYAELVYRTLTSGSFKDMTDASAFLIMPDHVHLLLGVIDKNLVEVIGSWKSYTTNLLHGNGCRGKIWQRSFWDHGIRINEDLINTTKYILNNPVRAGLVHSFREYSYSWSKWEL